MNNQNLPQKINNLERKLEKIINNHDNLRGVTSNIEKNLKKIPFIMSAISIQFNLIIQKSNNFDDFKQKFNKFSILIAKDLKDLKSKKKLRNSSNKELKDFLNQNLGMTSKEIYEFLNILNPHNNIPEPHNNIPEPNSRPVNVSNKTGNKYKEFRFRNEEPGQTLTNVREFEINLIQRGENLGMSGPATLKKTPVPIKHKQLMSNENFRKAYEDNPNFSKISINNAKKKGNKMANPNWLNKEEEISSSFRI
jgi:hypothetical protein